MPALTAAQISGWKSSQRPPSGCELSAAPTNATPRAPSSTIGTHSASGSGAVGDGQLALARRDLGFRCGLGSGSPKYKLRYVPSTNTCARMPCDVATVGPAGL